jgi:hypothetical protein
MPKPWWEELPFQLCLVLLVSLPIAFADLPPFIDLPAHLGRYAVQLDAGRSPDLARYYSFHWGLIGNLGVDIAIIPFAKIFGLERGLQILMAIVIAASSSALLLVSREVHGRTAATAMLALIPVYNYFLMFGFLNFYLGLALSYAAFALWLHLTRLGKVALRTAAFLPISLILWVCHIEAWAVAVILCWFSRMAQHHQSGIGYVKAGWLATIACLPFAISLIPMILMSNGGEGLPISGWFQFYSRATKLVTVLRDRWYILDIPIAAILYALVAAALLGVAKLKLSRVLAFPAAGLFLFFFFLPQQFLGTMYGPERLLAPALILALLAIDPSHLSTSYQHGLAAASTLLVCVSMAAHAWSFSLYDREFKAQLTAIDYIERGRAVVVLTGTGCQASMRNWARSRLNHISGVAVARKHVFANDQFATKGQQLLEVRYVQAAPFTSDPSSMVGIDDNCRLVGPEMPSVGTAIDRVPRAAFDYAWLIDVPPSLWPERSWLTPVWSNKNSILYRIGRSS